MKAYSLVKFTTFVSMIFMVSMALGEPSGNFGARSGKEEIEVNNNAACMEAKKAVSAAWSSSIGSCKSSGFGSDDKTCRNKLSECSEEEEESIDTLPASFGNTNPLLSSLFSLSGGTSSSCYSGTKSEYRTEEKDIKQELKDDKKFLSELKKDSVKAKEEYEKSLNDIDEKMQEMDVDKVTQELEYQKAQREGKKAQQQSVADMKKSIQDVELSILKLQQEMKNKANLRLIKIQEYRMELLSCKIDAEEKGAKYSPKARQAGGLSSAAGALSRADFMKQIYDICVKKVLSTRDADMANYNDAIQTAEMGVAFLQTNLTDLKNNLATAEQQHKEENSQAEAAKQQKDYLDLEKKKNLLSQKTQAATTYQQKYAQNVSEINEAQNDVTTSSNELSQFQSKKKPRGTKSLSETFELLDKYDTLKRDCVDFCKAAGAEVATCTKDGTVKSSPSSKPSSDTKGADGN